MADLSWVDTLSESEAGAILKFKTNGIDSLSEEEAGLLLPHVGKLKQKEVPPPEPTPVADYLSNSFKNMTGGLTGVADIAMGLPKMALSIPTAAIKTAMGGDPGQERVDAQNAAESLFGTPSKILNQMGVPEEYTNQNAGHKAVMWPFEKVGELTEYLGDRTGDKFKAGITKQALDTALLGLPIPGAKLAGKAAKTVFDPFVSARKTADFNAIKAGDVSKMAPEETSLYDGVKAVENGKTFRKAAAEQMKAEEAANGWKQEPTTGDYVPELPNSERMLSEAGYSKALEQPPVEQPLPFVPELYNGDAPLLQGHTKKRTAPMTEAERLAAEREQSLSDPLKFERTPVEPRMPDYIPQEAGLPFSREGKLSTPVEMGTHAKSVQQGIRDVREIASEVEQLKTDLVDKTEVGPEQRMAIQSLEHDLQNASGRTAANLEEVAQIGRDLAQLKIKTAEGTKTPKQVGPNRGKFGQGGAITPDVFLGVFPEFATSKIVDAIGKLKVLYHGGKALVSGMPTKGTGIYGEGVYLTDSPGRANQYAKSGGGTMYPAYVDIKNPISSTEYANRFGAGVKSKERAKQITEQLKQEGYDGVVSDMVGKHWEVVSFYPEKAIKSATSGATPKQQTLAKDYNLANKMSERLGTPLGQTGFGKGQRGSIDVGAILDSLEQVFDDIKPKTLDEFILAAKQAGIQASESVYETMFTGKQGEARALQTVQSGQGIQAFGKRVSPSLERFMSPWKDRTSAEVVDIIKNLPDNNATDLGIISGNIQSKGRLGVQRHANEGVQAGVAYMTQLYENAKIEGNQLLNNAQTGVSAIARTLETLTGEGRAFEVFKQIFEHQLDPDNHQFHLDNSQKALLDSIKKTTDKIWNDFVEQVQKISPEKAERLAKMKQDYYIPHQFFGDFISYVRDADGRLVTYVAERTERGAKAAIEHLKQELGSEYQFDTPVYVGDKSRQLGKKAEAGRIGVNMQEGMAGQFDYMIDLLSSDDVHVQRAQRAVQSVLNRRAMSSEGMTNRTKINTNVGGFFGKKGWKSDRDNYFDAKDSFERYVNGFHEWKGNMQVADFLNDIKDNAPDKINTYATLKNEFEAKVNPSGTLDFPQLGKAFANVTGFSPKEVTNGARGLSSFITLNALGYANPVMILQNFVQSPITQAVQAANLYGHGANFNPASVLGNILMSSWDGLRNGATNPKWQKYAFEHEIGDPGLVTTHGKTKAGSAIKEYTAAKSVTASEQVSRIGYFYGMTKTLIDSGYPEAKALEIAKNMTRDHMGNYENYAKPGAMTQLGIAGELAGRLQTYGVNAFTQFSQAAADVFKGIKEGNPRLLVPFAMFIASQYLAGGMNGTIPMDVAEKLHWSAVKTGMIPPDMKSPRQYLLEEHPNVAVSPLSRATGVWTEGSFRANVPLLSAPVPQKMVEMAKEIPEAINWIRDMADPQNRVSHLDKARVLEVFLPTAIRGTIEKKYLVNNNGVMVSKGTGRPMYKMGLEDDGVTSYTNLRSYNRGLTSEISNLATQREMAISEKKKALEKSFNEKLSGAVGHGQKLSPQYVTETIKKDFSYGGDIDKTMERALKFATEAGYPNQLVLGIINSEKNAFKMQRMSKSYKALQESSQ